MLNRLKVLPKPSLIIRRTLYQNPTQVGLTNGTAWNIEERESAKLKHFVVTLDNGSVNVMNEAFLQNFTATLVEIEHRIKQDGHHARPIHFIAKSTSKAYSAGLDLRYVHKLSGRDLDAFLKRFDNVVINLFAFNAPTYAVINGPALAGGAVFAFACDYRVGVEDNLFGLNEAAFGIPFPGSQTAVNQYKVIPAGSLARNLLMDGKIETVRKWHEANLFDQVLPTTSKEKILDASLALADENHSFGSLLPYGALKRSLINPALRSYEVQKEEDVRRFVDLFTSPAVQKLRVDYFKAKGIDINK